MSPLFSWFFSLCIPFFGYLGDQRTLHKKKIDVASRHKKAKISEAQNGIPHNVEDVPFGFPALSAKPRDLCSKDGSFKYICFSASKDGYTYYIHLFFWEKNCVYPSLTLSAPPPKQHGRSFESFALTDGRNPAITSWCW